MPALIIGPDSSPANAFEAGAVPYQSLRLKLTPVPYPTLRSTTRSPTLYPVPCTLYPQEYHPVANQGIIVGTTVITPEQHTIIKTSSSVKQFLGRLQLLPLQVQQGLLSSFISKIKVSDTAMASQLESRTIRVTSQQEVFRNPANAAERVTLTEIECDHGCSWDHACRLAADAAPRSSWFLVMRDKPNEQIFLAVQIDAERTRMCYPQRISAGLVTLAYLNSQCLVIPQEHMRMAKAQWERNWKYAVDGKHHLESFALVNGSVFSIWHHMRKATNPNFDPDAPEPKHGRRSMCQSTHGPIVKSPLPCKEPTVL